MSAALLFPNAPSPDRKLLRAVAKTVDCVVCADGGLNAALACGIEPAIVIGDMDSRPRPLPKIPGLAWFCDFDENRSDFEKSLAWIREAGFERVFVSGVRGGRADHELVNWTIVKAWSRKLDLAVVDGGVTRLLGKGAYRFPAGKGRTVSLAVDSPSAVVSLSGVKYRLRKTRLVPGSRGLSNVCLGNTFRAEIHSGRVWVSLPAASG